MNEWSNAVVPKSRNKSKYNLFFKDFESVRDIVRSAFLYGGYSKADYCGLTGISPRKYEDGIRFMQAVFGENYCTYEKKGREKYARLNYKAFESCTNPLTRVAFFMGFTNNDFNCYFYALDILCGNQEGLTIDEIADEIAKYSENLNTIGTIRNAINSLVDEGYLIRVRRSRKDYYSLAEDISTVFTNNELTEIADFIAFVKDTNNYRVPLDKDIKERAEGLFTSLGIDMNAAVNIFLRKAIEENGIPFRVSTNKRVHEMILYDEPGTLNDLFKDYNGDFKPEEWDTGKPVGNEIL